MKVLLDEMYPPALAERLRAAGLDALTAAEAGVAGRPDPDVLETTGRLGAVLLTENVADFARLGAELVAAGRNHPGILIALSSRFTRRPSGRDAIAAAVEGIANVELANRVIFLERT